MIDRLTEASRQSVDSWGASVCLISSYNDEFVGALAIAISFITLAAGIGPWSPPYEIRSMLMIVEKFGKRAARILWVLIAIASLVAGIAVLSGIRPSYAQPMIEAGQVPAGKP